VDGKEGLVEEGQRGRRRKMREQEREKGNSLLIVGEA